MPAAIDRESPLYDHIMRSPRFQFDLSPQQKEWFLQLVAEAIERETLWHRYEGWKALRLSRAFLWRTAPVPEYIESVRGEIFWFTWATILSSPRSGFKFILPLPRSKWRMYDAPIGPKRPLRPVNLVSGR